MQKTFWYIVDGQLASICIPRVEQESLPSQGHSASLPKGSGKGVVAPLR